MKLLAGVRFAAAIAAFAPGGAQAAADCLDVSKQQLVELSGELTYRVFPGPPNFADVNAGDSPEPAFILVLPRPICVGGEGGEAGEGVSTIELLPTERTAAFMRPLVDSQVLVSLAKPIAVSNPHRHAPLSAAVTGIAKLEASAPEEASAASVVRGFYESLGRGDGEQAATFVLPELRRGPLSAQEMSRFYSQLPERLRLTDLKQTSSNEYVVSYTFKAVGKACIGRAVVQTVNRSGSNYISHIKALDGC